MYGAHSTFGDLTGPPRSVPLGVKINTMFGGFSNQFGWLFFGIGLLVSIVVIPRLDWSPLTFRGDFVTTSGVVTKVEKTRYHEGSDSRSSSSGTPVYEVQFTYQGPGGQEGTGTSYCLGEQVQEGARVNVEYLKEKPHLVRIRGMRMGHVKMFGLFVLIFPTVGLCFMFAGWRKGRRGVHLLINGIQGKGKLIELKQTNTRVNKMPVYKLTFEFKADDGQTYQAVAKTHKTAKLQDEAEEPLLYDQFDPSRAIMMDDLPGNPRIDENGQIQSGLAAGAIKVLFVPTVVVIANVLIFYFFYVR